MCTNFTPTQRAQWAKDQLGVDLPAGYPAEAWPGFAAPIALQSHRSGRMACGLARFGLIPAWAKDEKIARHTYNARSETAAEKPSYRDAWRHRQYGLVLADNFFDPCYATGQAVRWRVALASGEPFGIACLWERWKNPATGELIVSFSILTVNADAHPVMNQLFKPGDEKRSPFIVAPALHKAWLGADPAQAAELMDWRLMPELVAGPAPLPARGRTKTNSHDA